MKKNIFFITIFLIGAVYLTSQYISEVDIGEQTIISKPNVITKSEPAQQANFDQAEWERKNQIEMDRREQIWLGYLVGKSVDDMKTETTYIEAYRDFKYYDNCIQVIENILNEMEPIAAVLNILPDRLEEVYGQLPDVQKAMINKRINKCVALTQFEAKVYHPERRLNELKAKMESITPKSSNEIELASVLQNIQQFERAHGMLQSLSKGENIDQQQFFHLWQQRKDIQRQYPQPLSFFGDFTPSDQSLIEQLDQQIVVIDKQIEANKSYDHEMMKTKQSEIGLLKETILNHLFRVKSSDAYLAIQELFNESRYAESFQPVLYVTKDQQKLIPDKYRHFITPVVTDFHACELAHPCGPDSVLVEQKCLDFSDQNAANACQSGILDYYLEYQLSPQQLNDVEFLLNEWY